MRILLNGLRKPRQLVPKTRILPLPTTTRWADWSGRTHLLRMRGHALTSYRCADAERLEATADRAAAAAAAPLRRACAPPAEPPASLPAAPPRTGVGSLACPLVQHAVHPV